MAVPGALGTRWWISDPLTAATTHSAGSVSLVICGSSQLGTEVGTGPACEESGWEEGEVWPSGWGGQSRIFLVWKELSLP